MTDESKRMALVVRKYVETDPIWAEIGSGRPHPMEYAAEMIEQLSDKCERLEADRDAWKRRAEAAEYDLQISQVCETCEKYGGDDELCEKYAKRENECGTKLCAGYKWRGPCVENGEDKCR